MGFQTLGESAAGAGCGAPLQRENLQEPALLRHLPCPELALLGAVALVGYFTGTGKEEVKIKVSLKALPANTTEAGVWKNIFPNYVLWKVGQTGPKQKQGLNK